MNPILAALQAGLEQLVTSVVSVAVPWLLALFQKHLGPVPAMQALSKEQFRATGRAWVVDALTELGTKVTAKLPPWAQPWAIAFQPQLVVLLDQEIEKALDAAQL